ncbi:uncharacterized protein SPSC_06055 [Sporisorium scitamineum]|uniref:Streptomycin biosynthesis protein StrI n=1 Tax=Sporisorium scitamineum TaxID=49012 RepID=A0A127ZIE9_9BASI|nr:uncharacterized protein SPSC_06055 [Sporisorium scitamineum]
MSIGETSRPVTLAIIGAGQRGSAYAAYAEKFPNLCKVVAVADPWKFRREKMSKIHNVPKENQYDGWKSFAEAGKVCDAVAICTMDDTHAEVVSVFAPLGYHILCEKPMANSIKDCVTMVDSVRDTGLIFGIGHVMRYSPYNRAVKEVLDSGVLGEIINIQHIEPVGWQHFAHSYVRGNWKNEATTSFSLMAKCCHDLDILSYYMGKDFPKRVSSFGSLAHFKPSKKPKEAGDATRCTDCAHERKCPYSAKKIYLEPVMSDAEDPERWAQHITDVVDIENVGKAIAEGPYGLCVYNGQNDVADNQVVNIEFETGATANITMVAFSEVVCNRSTRIHGTRGELIGNMESFTVFDFSTQKKRTVVPKQEGGGHGGGDMGLARAFVKAVAEQDASHLGVTPEDVLRSHLMVFASEASRKEGRVVDYGQFEKEQKALYSK